MLQQLLATFEYVSVSTRPQGYPKLCSLVIRYQTTAEKEEKLFQLIDTKRLMHLKFALSDPESQSVPGVYIEVPSIVQHLAERNVLEQQWPLSAGDASTTGSHLKTDWYGFERGIHFYTAQLDPVLFGFAEGPVDSALLFQRWSQLVDLFQPVEGHPDLKMISKQSAAEKIVISAPVPSTPLLEVSY
ncbi:hypothetical protein KDD30_07145 [Photobacterium sp. GJ3]|uniref:hypothetical protein n=1 Tax=Photobacterium sp. GJ3 TaxID=2829502 RepID=UPI001B8CCB5C|nr:hypothetical protein [Photobacterium sp. GJ3]QUJ68851.1 hypothetical protein KDD30_07145 [Photobacterium sp. GJ3]